MKGNMQLFSVDQQRSQALEAHAASFASFKVMSGTPVIFVLVTYSLFYYLPNFPFIFPPQVVGNENPSTLICFASKTTNAGQITSKLHVIELGAQPGLSLEFFKICFVSIFKFLAE